MHGNANCSDPSDLPRQCSSACYRLHQPDFRICHDRACNYDSRNHRYFHNGHDTGTVSIPGTSMPTTTSVTPSVSLTDDKTEKVRIRARNFAFAVSRITVPAGSLVTVEFENEDNAPHNVAFSTTPSLVYDQL
jgi:plastocyanin